MAFGALTHRRATSVISAGVGPMRPEASQKVHNLAYARVYRDIQRWLTWRQVFANRVISLHASL